MAKSDNTKRLAFLVDDDKIYLKTLENYLIEKMSRDVTFQTFETGEACLAALDQNPDFIFLDYNLATEDSKALDGVAILKEVKNKLPDTHVVMLSGQDKIEVAVESIKGGAYDYIVKGEGASIRAAQVIKNILVIFSTAKWLKLYRKGFFIALGAWILLILATAVLYIFFPQYVHSSMK